MINSIKEESIIVEASEEVKVETNIEDLDSIDFDMTDNFMNEDNSSSINF